jgi:hypothetical protein
MNPNPNPNKKNTYKNDLLTKLQDINNGFFNIFKNYGTLQVEDLLYICFGNDYIKSIKNENSNNDEYFDNKYDFIKKYFKPFNFKILTHKQK